MSASMIKNLFRSCNIAKSYSFRILDVRPLITSSWKMGAHDASFNEAKERLGLLKEDPGNQVKLQLYALFKQATEGKVKTSRPGLTNFVGRAKWDAWKAVSELSQDDAQNKYISIVNDLAKQQGVDVAGQSSTQSTSEVQTEATSSSQTEGITVTIQNNMHIIRLDRPQKKNAITVEMYKGITEQLKIAGADNTKFTVITGTGDYYSSGNDLSNFTNIDPSNIAGYAKDAGELLRKFVGAFIDFPKPLIGVINGPAVGVTVTVLALFNAVYATDKATFNTPFTVLGQTPEGCSSYTFPRMMGPAKANEVLIFNKKLTAREAFDRGLVTEVFPNDVFQKEVWERLEQFAKLPPETMQLCKEILRDVEKETLHRVNERECEQLVERWQSAECMNAIMNFFQSKI